VTPSRCMTMLAAGGFEGLAAAAVARGAGGLALGLHAISCACFAGGLHRRLLEGAPAGSFGLLFGGALFLPVLGALGLAVVALATPHRSSSPDPELVRTPVPGPAAAAAPAAPPLAARVLGRSSGREARLAAVTATRGRSDPGSIALLWGALADPDEDMRLLAHAMLESRSRTAHRAIHERTRELETASGARRGALHRLLAEEHWELVRLGLVQGECLGHALGAARRHALAALETDPGCASVHFLLGRVALRRGEPREAESALLRAAELGLPASALEPYLAEAAFLGRRFELVRRRLAEPTPANETVDRLRRYWA
jgi:polysaccharide biosynthesis protein PelE